MKRPVLLGLSLLATVAAPALAAEESGASGPLVVNGGLMIWTLVVFGLLLFTLRRFAWPAILGAVEAREQSLERQLAEAAQNRAEAEKLLEEQRRLLSDARSQAQSLLTDAKAAAEKERGVALERTRQEQEDLLARARREITAEREKAVLELRREAVDLSLAAASRLIGQRLGTDADRQLVEQYLTSLERAN
ncbi:MAG: F0F1 ATP synthase subunit B [Gemmatimonadales bacterium]